MKELFGNDAPWEGALIEGPFVVRQDGWFYSSIPAAAVAAQL